MHFILNRHNFFALLLERDMHVLVITLLPVKSLPLLPFRALSQVSDSQSSAFTRPVVRDLCLHQVQPQRQLK
jgi:hypothetical protein